MTKDETIEPSLAENNGLTPSKHGFSAAAGSRSREEEIVAAYKRGFEWCIENLSNWQARQFVDKAARDYADYVTSTSRLQPAAASEGASPEAVNPSALRAQVIEECAKVAERIGQFHVNNAKMNLPIEPSPIIARDRNEVAQRIAVSIRSLSAVSAIAQERDVGKPVAWRWKWVDGQTWMFSASEPDDDGLREIQPLYLHPTTSPKAIGEEPSSSEAVDTTPQSIEVGEMVERLKTAARNNHAFAERGTDANNQPIGQFGDIRHRAVAEMHEQSASLLISLDAERGRLREALSDLVKMHDLDDPYDAEHVKLFNLVIERARSALPASDEG